MSPRTELVLRLAALVGQSLVIDDLQDGWPSLISVDIDGDRLGLAAFVARTGLSSRGRDDIERRFQNPGQGRAIVPVPGRISVLLGVWEGDGVTDVDDPVVTVADVERRSDGRVTRWSVFVGLTSLAEAAETGWSLWTSDSGEELYSFRAELFPAVAANVAARVAPDDRTFRATLQATGYFDSVTGEYQPPLERVRRAVTILARNARFRGRVLDCFDRRCAMCGLGYGLVQGAHIYPASAPGASDEVWNGVALCANHHLAFDRHLVAIDPFTWEVRHHPDLIEQARSDPAARRFVESAASTVSFARVSPRLVSESLERRYFHFSDMYGWL